MKILGGIVAVLILIGFFRCGHNTNSPPVEQVSPQTTGWRTIGSNVSINLDSIIKIRHGFRADITLGNRMVTAQANCEAKTLTIVELGTTETIRAFVGADYEVWWEMCRRYSGPK
jgi:hypothetical protein